eukprot:sb/3465363/
MLQSLPTFLLSTGLPTLAPSISTGFPTHPPSHSTSLSSSDFGELEISPSALENMFLTKWMIIPSALTLIFSCTLLILTVVKHQGRLIHLFYSLILFTSCELFLLLQLTVCFLFALFSSPLPCGLWKSVGMIALSLPLFSVLLIAISRIVFVRYPLRYRSLLPIRVQSAILLGFLLYSVFLGVWPAVLGTCSPYMDIEHGVCLFDRASPYCSAYLVVYVVMAIALPTLCVLLIYGYVMMLNQKYRKRARHLSGSKQRESVAPFCAAVLGIDGNKIAGGVVLQNHTATPSGFSSLRKEKPRPRSRSLSLALVFGEERLREVPWLIVIVNLVHLAFSVPWTLLVLYTSENNLAGSNLIWLDLGHVSVLLSCALSPLLYIACTRILRERARKMAKMCLFWKTRW